MIRCNAAWPHHKRCIFLLLINLVLHEQIVSNSHIHTNSHMELLKYLLVTTLHWVKHTHACTKSVAHCWQMLCIFWLGWNYKGNEACGFQQGFLSITVPLCDSEFADIIFLYFACQRNIQLLYPPIIVVPKYCWDYCSRSPADPV